MIALPTNQIMNGDALTHLKELPSECVNMVMTSPPYWALRDYGVDGQLGLEQTFEEYIDKLCNIFDEVKRVLRRDGTCWVNLGDSYSGNMGKRNGWTDNKMGFTKQEGIDAGAALTEKNFTYTLPDKSLCMIPFRFAIEMVNRGWNADHKVVDVKLDVELKKIPDEIPFIPVLLLVYLTVLIVGWLT